MAATRIEGLTKRYGAVPALDDVSLTLEPGRVHALLGPNGAGKSTLIKCISGAIRPTSGQITIGEETHAGLTPREAMDAGVSVIYQQFSLVGHLSVADNVFLGNELRTSVGTVRRKEQERRTAEVLARLEMDIDPRGRVERLSIAEQQCVEIAKAVNRRARLAILDEPTASLSSTERASLMRFVRSLKAEGVQVLYITHLLDEVRELADDVTVLRDGRVALSGVAGEFSVDDLITAISGGTSTLPVERRALSTGRVVLEVTDLEGDRVGPISIEVRSGEVLGVFGLLGSGRTELLESIFGVRRRVSGRVAVDGRIVDPRGPGRAIEAGIALVPAERIRQSLFAALGVADNLLAAGLSRMSRWGWLRRPTAERAAYSATSRDLQIQAARPTLPVLQLSGGNQQKTAIGRWLVDPERFRVLLLDEPTQGIDVGTRAELYRLVRRMSVEQGLAVVVTSSYPEEICAVADRAIVLRQGKTIAELTGPEITSSALLRHANGFIDD